MDRSQSQIQQSCAGKRPAGRSRQAGSKPKAAGGPQEGPGRTLGWARAGPLGMSSTESSSVGLRSQCSRPQELRSRRPGRGPRRRGCSAGRAWRAARGPGESRPPAAPRPGRAPRCGGGGQRTSPAWTRSTVLALPRRPRARVRPRNRRSRELRASQGAAGATRGPEPRSARPSWRPARAR